MARVVLLAPVLVLVVGGPPASAASGVPGVPDWPVKRAAAVEGDVVLGGLMMVHEREDNLTCGPIMPQGGIQALECMLFTLDWVNRQPDLLPFSLGAYVLDDCDKDTYGLEQAVDFIKGEQRTPPAPRRRLPPRRETALSLGLGLPSWHLSRGRTKAHLVRASAGRLRHRSGSPRSRAAQDSMPHPPPPACAFSRIAGAAGHGLPLRRTVSRCNLAVSLRTACNGSPDTCHANRPSPRAARGRGWACAPPCGPLGLQQVPTRELRQQFALAANARARDASPVMRHGERT
ncbi:hypothetical protein HPB48_006586 [Haemaphysalis longicornis]|uniref:Receptor ligand binding region domain-containing protein n=1 Tax=Haemaphysalis longicornis TaxID=44386 RepID=A0A9J6GLM3_HAELO|nr:hypothetical protein HPB48_006586 [Haemaphysalis longicornis]